MEANYTYLGKGVFSFSQAAALTGLKREQVSRWVQGTNQGRASVFNPDFASIHGKRSLSFLDLIEVLFIDAYRRHGVSWSAIRVAAQRAASLLDFSHPFAKRSFYTNGNHIWASLARTSGDPELLNLIEVQYEFDAIVRPTLYENLDFGDLDVASRWWPNGREAKVFVDPRYNMGKPTVADGNVATSVLEQLFRTTGSMREVADWYEIDLNVVEAAVAFESSLAA